jgi:hypothetical protein
MHLIIAYILVLNRELVEITCDVVSGARIDIPIGVNLVGCGS